MNATAVAFDEAALAAILIDLGYLDDAKAILRRVLRAYRRKFGRRHYETSSVLANLGALYAKSGNFEAAGRTLRDALSDLEKVLGRHHPRLAPVLNNLWIVCAFSAELKGRANDSAAVHTGYGAQP